MIDTDERHSPWYIDRFRTMAVDGAELAGEAPLRHAVESALRYRSSAGRAVA